MLIALGVAVWVLLAVFALRGAAWAYAVFVVLAFVWIPARAGFHFHRPPCEMPLTFELALVSLLNYKHIFLFAMFFLMTRVQLGGRPHAVLIAAAATLAIGALIEIEQGATGNGHCRVRDLVPDTAGALIGAAIAGMWRKRGSGPGSGGNSRG